MKDVGNFLLSSFAWENVRLAWLGNGFSNGWIGHVTIKETIERLHFQGTTVAP